MAKTWYCKAAFQHVQGAKCEHVVMQSVTNSKPHVARRVTNTIVPDDYYSDEATARRREENKQKYQPTRRPFVRNQTLVGNEAKEGIYG